VANVKEAVDFVLRQEDSTLSGVVTNTPADRGGLTRFGITAKWHPDLLASGFFQTNRDEALAIAEEVYGGEYIPHLNLAAINRTAVAAAILSFAVVEGAGRAVLILQRVLTSLGFPLVQDGSVGPKTITAINAADPVNLVYRLVGAQREYFREIVATDPTQEKWLKGWINRANAVLQFAQRTLVQ
jgi:type VI secretion system secreted protein VgrG